MKSCLPNNPFDEWLETVQHDNGSAEGLVTNVRISRNDSHPKNEKRTQQAAHEIPCRKILEIRHLTASEIQELD